MSQSEQQKVVQYLNEAHATEHALVRVLQSQIAMTPRGSYRNGLETHLRETRGHADRIGRRLQALGEGSNPLAAVIGALETVVGQALALGKTPFDLLRGSGGEEKVLKNAKDACATEALEILPTRRSSVWPALSATTRQPSWPPPSSPTRRRCSSGSCARSRS
jgi:hypothetical protein